MNRGGQFAECFLFLWMQSFLPDHLLDDLENIPGYNREAFVLVHESGVQVTAVRLNAGKVRAEGAEANISQLQEKTLLPLDDRIPWTDYGYYLSHRPSFTLDPLFHAGVYYVQEASGMFLEQVLKRSVDLTRSLRVLDLCAAPGGKSTLLQSMISADSLLVSNEVIKSRASILEDNLTRWGAVNTIVTNNDPAAFARLEDFFDVIMIDAPCSGSGLFRREPELVTEWSRQHVQLCCQRQQRIIADVYPALKKEGVMIYSTCSYSREEDEEVLDRIMDEWNMESIAIDLQDSWQVVPVESARHKAYGYRFFPDKVKGEGFFIAVLKKKDGGQRLLKNPKKTVLQQATKKDMAVLQPWILPDSPLQYWQQGERLMVFPAMLEKELLMIAAGLYIRKAGVVMGKIAGKELVPDHTLALSTIVSDEIVGISLNKEDALQYLRKEEVNGETVPKGWSVVRYQGHNLGWIKGLGNRVNNYYPAHLRILKRS